MASWLVVTTPDNYARTRELGFTMQGFKTRQRKNVMERVRPGDRLAYYLSRVQAFGATATITSEGFEDHELVWQSKPGEDYPYRVRVEADIVRDEDGWVPSEVIGPGLQHVQRWPQEHWKLAFRGNLHQIPDPDFDTIRAALAPEAVRPPSRVGSSLAGLRPPSRAGSSLAGLKRLDGRGAP